MTYQTITKLRVRYGLKISQVFTILDKGRKFEDYYNFKLKNGKSLSFHVKVEYQRELKCLFSEQEFDLLMQFKQELLEEAV